MYVPLDSEITYSLMLISDKGTAEVQVYPLPDSQIFIIDTPGFDDSKRSDTDILQSIASCLADLREGLIFEGQEIDLSGIIYMHPINQMRMDGPGLKNLRMLLRLAGNDNMKNLTLVTSKWGTEDANKAEDRESELINNVKFWKEPIAKGATMKRFEDSRRSALEIFDAAIMGGRFTPQLTREYVIEGKELCKTAAGRAIDEDLAKAREEQEMALETLREEHDNVLRTHRAELADELGLQARQLEVELKSVDDEMDRLRTTREEVQEREDELDPLISPDFCEDMDWIEAKAKRRRARQKRAMRWFARFAGLGAGIAMSVLSHGALAPVACLLVREIEKMCQVSKKEVKHRNREN